ncbi:MAG TPA: DUF3343 domain-containing protein [bacterium]|nr:DUF3343 domain-containing protein [bacterium]HPN32408.1 DUF3343 domain-containing protein [bacterium]
MIIIITAFSNYTILKISKTLDSNGITSKKIPTPREISSDCGMSIMIETEDLNSLEKILIPVFKDVEHCYLKKEINFEKFNFTGENYGKENH